MSVSISGILLDPYGNPAPFAEVKFITWQGALDVLTTSSAVYKTSSDGVYSFAVEFGTFTVQVRYNQSNGKFETIKKKVIVNSGTTATTLGELLLFNEPLTPPEIEYVKQLVAEAEGYRDETLVYRNETEVFRDDAAQSAIDAANSAALIAPIPLNGGVWASGQTYEFYNQYMIYNGEAYSPRTEITLPYTVGATPDLNFVYQIKLNSLQALSGLTEPSDLAQRHRIETTVAEIATGVFKVGDKLTVTDRDNAPFDIVSGGVADGFGVLNAGTGKTAALLHSHSTTLEALGADGTGVNSCLDSFQYAIDNYNSILRKDSSNYNLGGGTLTLKSNFSLLGGAGSKISNGVILGKVAGLTGLCLGDLFIEKVLLDFGGVSTTSPAGNGNKIGNIYSLNGKVIIRHLRGDTLGGIVCVNDSSKVYGDPLATSNLVDCAIPLVCVKGDFDFGWEIVGETTTEATLDGCDVGLVRIDKEVGSAEVNGHHGFYLKGARNTTFEHIHATGFSDSNNQRNDLKIRDCRGCKVNKITAGYLQITSDANLNGNNYTLDNVLEDVVVSGQAQLFTSTNGRQGGNKITNFSGKLIGTTVTLADDYDYTWQMKGDIDLKTGSSFNPRGASLLFNNAIVDFPDSDFDGTIVSYATGIVAKNTEFKQGFRTNNGSIFLESCIVGGGVNQDSTSGTYDSVVHNSVIKGRLRTNSFGSRVVNADWAHLDIQAGKEAANDYPDGLSNRFRFVSFNDGYILADTFITYP